MPGGTRVPTNVHKLTGSGKHNRARIAKQRAGEPMDDRPLGKCPPGLTADEKRAFREISRRCIPGVLTYADGVAVEAAAKLLAKMRAQTVVDDVRKTELIADINATDFFDPAEVQRVMLRMVRFIFSTPTWNASDMANFRALLGQFGMMPADRSKISLPTKEKETNPFADL